MAEFCPKCWNELNGFSNPSEAYILSFNLELCEGCGEWKRVVIGQRKIFWLRRFLSRVKKR